MLPSAYAAESNFKNYKAQSGLEVNPAQLTLEKNEFKKLSTNSNLGSVTWSSANNKIAMVSQDGIVTGISPGTTTIIATTSDGEFSGNCEVTVIEEKPHLSFRTHVENIGWDNYETDRTEGGTTGQALRLEAIQFKLVGKSGNDFYGGLGLKYRSHVQDIGWESYKTNNAISGTTGQAKKIEAIQLSLTGTLSNNYDIYYRTHCEDIGWTGWAKDGQACGTEGFNRRLEAIEVKLLSKDDPEAPTQDAQIFYSTLGDGNLRISGHSQDIGWQDYVNDGQIVGTTDQNKSLEAFRINPNPNLPEGTVQARAYIQGSGWSNWIDSPNVVGTVGESKRIFAIELRLTGPLANEYNISYQIFADQKGWEDWVSDGQAAGKPRNQLKIEAINIKLVHK